MLYRSIPKVDILLADERVQELIDVYGKDTVMESIHTETEIRIACSDLCHTLYMLPPNGGAAEVRMQDRSCSIDHRTHIRRMHRFNRPHNMRHEKLCLRHSLPFILALSSYQEESLWRSEASSVSLM